MVLVSGGSRVISRVVWYVRCCRYAVDVRCCVSWLLYDGSASAGLTGSDNKKTRATCLDAAVQRAHGPDILI